MRKLLYISFWTGVFLALPGSVIWAFIFWNNDNLFLHHWTVGLLGIGLVFVGVWPVAEDIIR